MAETDVGVSKGVDHVKEDEISSDDDPMLVSTQEIWEKKCWTECSNVDEMFLEILHEGGGRQGIDGQVVETMHGFHVFWNVQPTVCEVIQWFDDQNVAP